MNKLLLLTLAIVMSSVFAKQNRRMMSNRRAQYLQMPKEICPPTVEVATFIADQAITCAMQFLLPGSGMINRVVKMGKQAVDKLHAMGPL